MDLRKPILNQSYELTFEKIKSLQPLAVGSCFYQLEPQCPPTLLDGKAKNELQESAENIDKALHEIREYLKDETDFTVPNNDYFFAKFLRPSRWHAKSAFELIKRYCDFYKSYPRYCKDLIPINDRVVLTSEVLTPLPLRAEDGCRVILIQSGKVWKPKEVSTDQFFRGLIMLLNTMLFEPATQINGIRMIIDMDGLSFSQVTYFTPSYAAAMLKWLQESIPIRLKSINIVNQPYIFNMVFAIFKPFMNEKLRKRIIFHGTDRESLKKSFGTQALPRRYGGDMELPSGPLGESFWNYMCQFNEEFKEINSFGYLKLSK